MVLAEELTVIARVVSAIQGKRVSEAFDQGDDEWCAVAPSSW